MTATIEETTQTGGAGVGRIARVIGPVVDVEFPVDNMPEMYNKLECEITLGGETTTLALEVAQHIGDGMVRAISLKPTDGLVRGGQVRDTGEPITVPVGNATLGKVFNTTGDCLNLPEGETLEVSERWGIHRKAPAFDQLESKTQMFETGIKVIDLLTPYVQGGKIGLFGGAGVGKTVLIQEMIARVARDTVVCRCSPAWVSAPVRATTSWSRWRRPGSSARPPWSSARWTSRRAPACASPCRR